MDRWALRKEKTRAWPLQRPRVAAPFLLFHHESGITSRLVELDKTYCFCKSILRRVSERDWGVGPPAEQRKLEVVVLQRRVVKIHVSCVTHSHAPNSARKTTQPAVIQGCSDATPGRSASRASPELAQVWFEAG